MKVLIIILMSLLRIIPSGQMFLEPLHQRDSALIADQFEYGFKLEKVDEGTSLLLPELEKVFPDDTLVMVRNWQIDTLKTHKRTGARDLRASILIAPFEPGEYELPKMYAVKRSPDGKTDTLEFDPQRLTVYTMQVDTSSFQIKDLKAQVEYPVTLAELIPLIGGALSLVALIVGLVLLVKKLRSRKEDAPGSDEPAYIVALRKLERFRGEKFWAPEKQKQFYSGITDTLKEYIGSRYGFDAPEMTTAELFKRLGTEKDLSPELFAKMEEMFRTADFVKFAKHTAGQEENVAALPLAIRFVMDTYKAEEEPQEQKD